MARIRPQRRTTAVLIRAVREFLAVEAAGGILLLAATVVAMAWANSPWQASYADLWHTEASLRVGEFELREDLRHWVNDALMVLFFFVVGLEIKRELVAGELQDRRKVALPVFAAIGGMVVPAALYLLLNVGGDGGRGWGIPMATDIAFALGVVALVGPRVPSSLKLFLLTLAVVDDIGAILVIAVAYTDDLAPLWLAAAVGGIVLMELLRRADVWYLPIYFVVGTFVWLATFESGVHATIAGAVLGLLAPSHPLRPDLDSSEVIGPLEDGTGAEAVHRSSGVLHESVSVAERLEHTLHPWTSYVVIPVFALANAGVVLTSEGIADAATSTVTLGVVLGLVVGKVVGVTGAAWLATRLGVADLPTGVRWPQVLGIGAIAGIGFTVSLFVGALAFDDPVLRDQATIGVLAASAVAAGIGSVVLRRASPALPDDAQAEAEPARSGS